MSTLLGASRFMVILAVIGALLAATTLLVYGLIETVQLILSTIQNGEVTRKVAKALALEFIEIIDLFLLGTVFYIVAIGLYELFISTNVKLPSWLTINNLDDLKNKLIAVVIVVLGVLFLGQVVSWDGERDLLGYGAAVALVIGALSYFLSQKTGGKTK
ncbi:YqhA family protein [Aliiroseovarius sp. PrR006]|uniref:YqhA family protein n=1 Tax=Aliiroseovarius sp. PrR006 TaxID=2706883 RepID=UPI0013D367F9|nr:YqhA family protein [Aliiroseovarius sp. PrR006]NDW53257.1 YqhA family protein [Aliiroseovarius sp. PrR006]